MIGVQSVLWGVDIEGPSEKGFKSPSNEKLWNKPSYHTGMWTSAYLGPKEISEWARWCRTERFDCGIRHLWLLTPKEDTNLIIIDNLDDLYQFLARPEQQVFQERIDLRFKSFSIAHIDFEALATMGIDGI